MKTTMKILAMACLFGILAGTSALAYEDVTPTEAYMLATADANVYILDVRTWSEWIYVGHPGVNKLDEGADLEGKVVNISYKVWKKDEFIVNKRFLKDIKKTDILTLFDPDDGSCNVVYTLWHADQSGRNAATITEADNIIKTKKNKN